MFYRTIIAASMAATLTACAPIQAQRIEPSAKPSKREPTPTCDTARLCEAMWSAAADAVSTASGMKVRMMNDVRIETYGETGYGLSYGVVLKTPLATGYEITASFSCNRFPGCDPSAAENTFNEIVNLERIRPK